MEYYISLKTVASKLRFKQRHEISPDAVNRPPIFLLRLIQMQVMSSEVMTMDQSQDQDVGWNIFQFENVATLQHSTHCHLCWASWKKKLVELQKEIVFMRMLESTKMNGIMLKENNKFDSKVNPYPTEDPELSIQDALVIFHVKDM